MRFPSGRSWNVPKPPRTAVLLFANGDQAKLNRGIQRSAELYSPRGAPVGMAVTPGLAAPGIRPTWSAGTPSPARMIPLYRLPEPGTIRPAGVTVTAMAGSYSHVTKLEMLFPSV